VTCPCRLNQIYPNDPTAIQPAGIRVNDTVCGQLTGSGPDLPSQLETLGKQLRALAARSSVSLENVAQCVGYVSRMEDRIALEAWWDDRQPGVRGEDLGGPGRKP
jgi:hypothetical protein